MIIGLCSAAPRAGKDKTAEFLFKYGFVRVAFGDSIKAYCKTHYHWNGKKDKQGRQLLTDVAMKMRDNVDPHFWIKQTAPSLERLLKEKKDIVVTDVRMLAEQDYLRNNFDNFFLVEVKRDYVTEGKDALTQIEIIDMDIDYTLDNNGSIENLQNNVGIMLRNFNFLQQ